MVWQGKYCTCNSKCRWYDITGNGEFLDGGYFSQVTIEGQVFKAEECCQTKKLAEQYAAKAGLIGMGVKDPESIASKLLGRYVNSKKNSS